MAIDVITFEQLHDRGKHLLHMDDADVNLLRPAFRIFGEKTGRAIDEYGVTPFPHGTLPPLMDVLRGFLLQTDGSAQGVALRELLGVLAAADRDGIGVVFDGD